MREFANFLLLVEAALYLRQSDELYEMHITHFRPGNPSYRYRELGRNSSEHAQDCTDLYARFVP